MPSHVCGNTNEAASPHRLRRVLCPVRLSVHLWHERERDIPTSPTSRRTPPASSWSSSQSCRSALTPTWSRPTGGARRIDHQGQSWRAPSPAGAFGALTGPAHGAHVDSPRAMWGGSAPVDELLSAPTGPISYRRMRCLGCPALGESTLRVFGVCVCPVAALRAPGAMLRR